MHRMARVFFQTPGITSSNVNTIAMWCSHMLLTIIFISIRCASLKSSLGSMSLRMFYD